MLKRAHIHFFFLGGVCNMFITLILSISLITYLHSIDIVYYFNLDLKAEQKFAASGYLNLIKKKKKM